MTRKETLEKHKEMIKLETIKIRSLKERNRILSRNHTLDWSHENELITLRKTNGLRHYWYFRLKNINSKKHSENILNGINALYHMGKTAVYLNKEGAEEKCITQLSKLEN